MGLFSKRRDIISSKEVCNSVEVWADGYFVDLSKGVSQVINVEVPDIPLRQCLSSYWADGQAPIISQHRDEIETFIDIIIKNNLRGIVLEIGLEYGGTHVLWRNLFGKVISIEKSLVKIANFLLHADLDERSLILCGDSTQRKTVQAAEKHAPIDLLFIDGGHTYENVYADYTLYRSLVRKGGIIAFHDTANRHPEHFGIQIFLARLKNKELDGRSHNIIDIIKSGMGISYEINDI